MAKSGIDLFEQLMRFKPEGLTPNGWAVSAGVSRTIWNDLRRHGNPSRRTLEKLMSAAGSSLAEFEALRVDGSPAQTATLGTVTHLADRESGPWRSAPLPPVPLLETANAGHWGEAASGIELARLRLGPSIAQLARPLSMASDTNAYALTVTGEAMWPRFRKGRHLLVAPSAPAAVGDDVALHLASASGQAGWVHVLVKELVKQTRAYFELRQFNPDRTFRVPAADIGAVHRIVGEAI